jgi:hypothetical protein
MKDVKEAAKTAEERAEFLKAYLIRRHHEAGRNLSFLLTKVEKWTRENLSFLDIDHPRHYTFFIGKAG